jgi:hypothetical protein
MSSTAAPVTGFSPPNVAAITMAKITKAPSSTAPVSTNTLETEEKTALSEQWKSPGETDSCSDGQQILRFL